MRRALALLLVASAAARRPFWSGGVTSTSAELRVQPSSDNATVIVSRWRNMSAPVFSAWVTPSDFGVSVTGLEPSTEYFYAFASRPAASGRFRTFADEADTSAPLVVALASCAYTGAEDEVFGLLAEHDPALFLMMGDMHYEDLGAVATSFYDAAYRKVLDSDSQRALYTSVPFAYTWDDHDYGSDDAESSFVGRTSTRASYQKNIPHYPLAAGSGDVPIYQAWTAAGVRFVMTDLRSEVDSSNGTTLGAAQRDWLLGELSAWADFRLVVWINSKPWLGVSEEGADHWGGFPEERAYVSERIAAMGVTNLLVVSGDAHMLAMDDGSHTDFAAGGAAGFPLFQAAPLFQFGSSKSGPYSEGCHAYRYAENNQYGIIEVSGTSPDDVCVHLKGYSVSGLELEMAKCAPLVQEGTAAGGTEECALPLFPWYIYAMWGAVVGLVGFYGYLRCSCCVRLGGWCGGVWGGCRRRGGADGAQDGEEVPKEASKAEVRPVVRHLSRAALVTAAVLYALSMYILLIPLRYR